MKKITSYLLTLTTALSLGACAQTSTQDEVADKVILGTVYVGDESQSTVEALAIKDGKIVYAGTKDGASAYVGDDTETITLDEEQLVIAGMGDTHCHAVISWDAQLGAAKIPQGVSAKECIEIITEYVKENPDRDYYLANGWYNSAFENGCPTKDLLDAIDTDKPIIATSSDGHSVWCNTAALENANITAETEAPVGGTIEKDADGNPNGCLRDNAIVLPTAALPEKTADYYIDVIKAAQEEYASLGYTSYNESMVNEKSNLHIAPMLEAYEQLDQEGELSVYVQGSYIVSNRDDYLDLVEEAIAYRDSTKGGDFEVTDIKIFMDGVIEGGTAYLSEAYANDESNYGTTSWATEEDIEKLTEIVVKANEAGMTVHFHGIGDQASTNAVAAVEAAYKQAGDCVKEARNVITHLQIVDDETIEKMAELNMVANLNPWCCKGTGFYEEIEVAMLGEDRASHEYPVKSFMEAGVHTSFGTDYGSSFTYDSIECYHIFVTRMEKSNDPATQLNPDEIITPAETINMMTSGSAYQMKKEDSFGTLEVGKDATLVVLSKNLLEIDDADIMDTTVQKTMVKGNWIFEAE